MIGWRIIRLMARSQTHSPLSRTRAYVRAYRHTCPSRVQAEKRTGNPEDTSAEKENTYSQGYALRTCDTGAPKYHRTKQTGRQPIDTPILSVSQSRPNRGISSSKVQALEEMKMISRRSLVAWPSYSPGHGDSLWGRANRSCFFFLTVSPLPRGT